MRYCHQCGHQNDEIAQYCENDGVRLESLDTSYRYEMQSGDYCTSCGHAREVHHVYCESCGYHMLEPKIGINRVEESFKSVAATGSQVFSHLKRATEVRKLPKLKNALYLTGIRPNLSSLIRGCMSGIIFITLVIMLATLIVLLIPADTKIGLSEMFGNEASSFKLFSLISVILIANIYWSLDIESMLTVGDELDSEAFSFLSKYPMMLDGKIGNSFFAFGGVLLVICLAFLLFRNVKSWQEGYGRFIGMFFTLVVSYVFLSFFAMDLTFINLNWFLTTSTTWFSFALAIGLGALLSLRVDGIWKAAQQGGRAIIIVTIFTTIIGTTYGGYQVMKLSEIVEEAPPGYEIATVEIPALAVVGQSLTSNWQNIGHGGTQSLEMQSPIISLSVGSSPFGSATPKEIEKNMYQLNDGITNFEYMIEDIVEYGEFPDERYAITKELPTLSPSLSGLIRKVTGASFAEDEVELERLYNEGIFSWFTVLVFINVIIYAAFAYRTVVTTKELIAFVGCPFSIYLIWQWLLNGGMIFTIGERALFEVSIDNLGFISVLISFGVIMVGGVIGWVLNRKNKINL